jgi:hypothetical protein
MPIQWEYCVLTRLSNGPDSKWHVNRVFYYGEPHMPVEVTESPFREYNEAFDRLHASLSFPILPAVLNHLGADGWELLDDMNTGLTGGEGLIFKRLVEGKRVAPARPGRAKARPAAKKPAGRKR